MTLSVSHLVAEVVHCTSTLYQLTEIWSQPNGKLFDNIYCHEMVISIYNGAENIVGKGYQHF